MPDLTDESVLSGKTQLRPFQAKLTDFRLNHLELDLVTPITCENFTCDLKVKLKNLDLAGTLGVNYTDKDEVFIPKTKMKLTSTDKTDVSLSAQAFINPLTGKLDDLVFLTQNQTHIEVKPGSFNFDLDFKKNFDSHEREVELHNKYYAKQMASLQEKFKSKQYLK